MKRWMWRVLLIAAAVAALTAGLMAAAAEGDAETVTLPNRLELKKATLGELGLNTGSDDQDTPVWIVFNGTSCSGVVTIPARHDNIPVVTIGESAFINAPNVTGVNIPESVVRIEKEAFANTKLTSLVVHNKLETIGEKAFANSALTSVAFLDLESNSDSISAEESLTIEKEAFLNCTGLISVDFPLRKTIIEGQAFELCTSLKEVLFWNGEIEGDAFLRCRSLKSVAIAELEDTTKVASAPTDNAFNLCNDALIIHYGGSPNPWTSWEVHTSTHMRKSVTPPDCTTIGTIYEYAECETPDPGDCGLSGADMITNRPTTIGALGHNYVVDTTTDAFKAAEAAEEAKRDGKLCQAHPWDYPGTCSRANCDATGPVTQYLNVVDHELNIVRGDFELFLDPPDTFDPNNFDPADFDLDNIDETENPEKYELFHELFSEEKFTVVDSTCGEAGSITWTAECKYGCGTQKTAQTVTLKAVDSNTHTYYKGNTETVEIEATCLYGGIEVTYLVCDGDRAHGGNHTGERKPCASGECESLLNAAISKINALKKAVENYTPDDEPDMETPRREAEEAVRAYKDHVRSKDHNPIGNKKVDFQETTECIVDFTETGKLKDEHSKVVPVDDEPELINPDRDGPYYCDEGGWEITKSKCAYCGEDFIDEKPVAPKNHDISEDYIERTPATCTEPARITYLPGAACRDCDFEIEDVEGAEPVAVDVVGSTPLGHRWGDFVPNPGQDTEPAESCETKKVKGTATCTVCGEVSEEHEIIIPGKAGHTWGDWVTTKQPTPTEDGEQTRTCKVCGEKQTQSLSYTAPEPDEPGTDEPGTDKPGTDEPGTSKPDTTSYTITVIQGVNGTVSASRSTATAGTRVTVTVRPNSGYEVDMVRVTGATFGTTLSDGRDYFTMPSENVEVRATFSRIVSSSNANWTGSSTSSSSQSTAQNVVQSVPKASAWGQLFSDIPATHWAAGEINWANQMGYMNGGSGGKFNPDGNITHQQMWMVMARLTGSNPSSMADAKRWAVNGGFADGSAPEGPVSRQQLVTALYRCAHLMGTSNRNTTTLAGFPDSRTVPAVAREPFAWAVANGIIGGNANGRLDPNGTLTRAQFAVILYRFSQRV